MKIIFLTVFALSLTVWDAPANAASAKISARDCQRVVRHQAKPNVAYKPGVDVRGKKANPADLGGGSTFKMPKEFSFNIGVDIAEKYGLDDKNISADLGVGEVTVRGSRVFMNGKQMTTHDQANMAEKCQKLLSGK
jgi:hypothetical protein